MTTEIPWERLVDELPIAVSVLDVAGHQVSCNQEYAAMLGYDREEVLALDVSMVTRADDRAWTRAYLDRLIRGEIDHYTTDKVYVRRDDTTFVGRLTSRALRDEHGRCTHLIGSITPVDPRPKVTVAQVRRMLGYTNDTLTLVDADGNVIETTGRYAPVMGYPPEFWETRTVFDLIGRDDVDRVLRLREDLLARPGSELETEIVVTGADGDEQILHVRAFNELDDPDLGAVVLVTRNITEHRRAVADLARAKRRAEANVDSQTRLLATVSHELRNPLHAAHGLLDLLVADELPAHAAETVHTLRRQLKSLAQVTDDLLDAARLDGGRIAMHPVAVDVGEMVTDVVNLARASAQAMGKVGDLDVSSRVVQGAPAWVLADIDRLRQVLSNLVGNAVKFTEHGSVQLVVRADGDDVVFSVIDTGVGIPVDEQEAVLKPFGVGSTAGDRRGAGLGLAVVQRIVLAMGGTLTMTSTVGTGTRFDVRVPLPVAAPPAAVRDVVLTPGLAVLVVEDNPVNQQLAQRQLERLGLVPTIAGTGEEALDLLGQHDGFAVVLMDQQLPGISGTETTRRIRLLTGAVARIPIVGVSASASSADQDAFVAAGMNAWISKPASLGDLSAVIAEVLAGDPSADAAAVGDAADASPSPGDADGLHDGGAEAVDVAILGRLADELGSAGVVASLVQTYLGELDVRIASMIDPSVHGLADPTGVAHTLKSSSRLVGATVLGAESERIERGGVVDAAALRRLAASTRIELTRWVAAHAPL